MVKGVVVQLYDMHVWYQKQVLPREKMFPSHHSGTVNGDG